MHLAYCFILFRESSVSEGLHDGTSCTSINQEAVNEELWDYDDNMEL